MFFPLIHLVRVGQWQALEKPLCPSFVKPSPALLPIWACCLRSVPSAPVEHLSARGLRTPSPSALRTHCEQPRAGPQGPEFQAWRCLMNECPVLPSLVTETRLELETPDTACLRLAGGPRWSSLWCPGSQDPSATSALSQSCPLPVGRHG